MRVFKMNGILVYFAAHTKHIGFYPVSSAISELKKELAFFQWSKGTIHFPLDKPLSIRLMTKIVKFRVIEYL